MVTRGDSDPRDEIYGSQLQSGMKSGRAHTVEATRFQSAGTKEGECEWGAHDSFSCLIRGWVGREGKSRHLSSLDPIDRLYCTLSCILPLLVAVWHRSLLLTSTSFPLQVKITAPLCSCWPRTSASPCVNKRR